MKRMKILSKDAEVCSELSIRLRKMCGFSIFGRGMDTLLKMVDKKMPEVGCLWIATVNPEFVMEAKKDREFGNILNKTWLNVPDGIGLIWASEVLERDGGKIMNLFRVGWKILKGGFRDNLITGVDLMDRLCELALKSGRSVYFLGGWGERAGVTANYFEEKYPGLKVAGFRGEDFDFDVRADFLFVAYGMKKQEEWIYKNMKRLKVKLVVGVGRSFDYYSGELKRAPKNWQNMGLEWLYSLFKQPSRWKRQLRLFGFVWEVIKSRP